MYPYAIVIQKKSRYFVFVRGIDGVYRETSYCPARGYGAAVDANRAAVRTREVHADISRLNGEKE